LLFSDDCFSEEGTCIGAVMKEKKGLSPQPCLKSEELDHRITTSSFIDRGAG